MKISIIIPTLNEEDYITETIKSINNQSRKVDEIIIVDCFSTDNTESVVKSFTQENLFFYQEKSPIANQRNYGACKSSGDLLIFLDADTTINKDFVSQIEQTFLKESIDLACPWYAPTSKSKLLKVFFVFFNLVFVGLQKFKPAGAGACIICRRDVFIKANGFANIEKFEDIEFIRRVFKNSKFKIINLKVFTSDRRFVKYGIKKMILKYIFLALYYTFGGIERVNEVNYEFGNYKQSP